MLSSEPPAWKPISRRAGRSMVCAAAACHPNATVAPALARTTWRRVSLMVTTDNLPLIARAYHFARATLCPSSGVGSAIPAVLCQSRRRRRTTGSETARDSAAGVAGGTVIVVVGLAFEARIAAGAGGQVICAGI